MTRPEFDSIRAYVDTLDAAEVLAYLPCILNDFANTAIEGLDDAQQPEMQVARRVHVAFLAAVLQIMVKRLVAVASNPADVARAHTTCDSFVLMLNQAKLRLVTDVHGHGGPS